MILVEATQRLEASGESSGDVEDDFPITSTGESGPWLLISIAVYLIIILIVVLYCLNRRTKSECSCLETNCCMGQCSCLKVCNCEVSLPSLTDCCPKRDPNEPSCFSSLCADCNCETEQPDPDPCCESGFLIGDCCKCQPSDDEIIQRKMANDPDYFLRMMQQNPQFQRSLREQNGMSQFQQNTLTTQPTSFSMGNQPTWSTINASSGQSMRLQTLSTDNTQSFS